MMKKAITDPYALRMVSVEQAAKIVGVSRSYMYQLINTGKMKSRKVGKLIKIRTADLEEFIDKLEINSYDDPNLVV
jgi:excisionase family DNA binding protein